MSQSRYPIQVVRGVPVIAAPAALDAASAGLLRQTLLHLAATGHATVVLDMSATTVCDAAGLAELGRAATHAAAEGGDLRLVTRRRALAEVLATSGLERVVRYFPTVTEAVAETPAVRIVPLRSVGLARAPRPSRQRARSAPLPVR
jgi:anti-anti-sigma factor